MVVGFCGSPREKATDYVLKMALEEMRKQGFETIFFTVKGKNINFCIHCDYCLKNKVCVFKDDMQEVYSLLKKADGIIFATPVYNGGVSAQTKAIMDRCRAAVAGEKNFFKNKIGIGLALGGDRVGGQEAALTQIITFYILNAIRPISGGYFGSNLGATFWTKDTLEGVKQDTEGFRSLKKTLKKFTNQLKNLQA
ncbi:flavodoxin family protein [Candidatus Bathyarchaeota archaeon]|nr:flavodoxin family protein [Candidatus Bathyarchaeota archaeon]MCJ7713575.1 flavodoxin family protein [Candidatus Bathyarchaeota archaeon]